MGPEVYVVNKKNTNKRERLEEVVYVNFLPKKSNFVNFGMFWFEESDENLWNPFTHLRNGYSILVDYLSLIYEIFQNYFWHGIFGALIFSFIYQRFLKGIISWIYQKYERYCERKREEQYAAKYHKNPDLFSARISAQQAQAQKLQEKYYQEALTYEERMRQKYALKQEEAVKQLDREKGPGHSLQDVKIDNQFKNLFEEAESNQEQDATSQNNSSSSSKDEYIRKLQEKYNQKTKEYQEKLKQEKETKRQETLAKMTSDSSSSGHRLGNGSKDEQKKTKSLRPEYNPLMGSGGSNYRPAKKSKCSGGGCG